MSDFDQLIATLAEGMNQPDISDACRKTLKNYDGIETQDQEGGPKPLRMIAWDRL